MLGTVLLYVVAMFGYAADLAFGDRRRAAAAAVRAKVLVSVGGGETADGESAAESSAAGPERREVDWGRFAILINVIGWGTHLGELITRGMAAQRLPWGNMYEFVSAICFAAVTAYLILLIRQNVRFIGVFLMITVVIGLGIATIWLYDDPGPLRPALHSYWIGIHVTAAIIATGTFTLAAVTTLLYVVVAHREAQVAAATGSTEVTGSAAETGGTKVVTATKAAGPPQLTGFLGRLPSSERLDRLSNRITMFGFPIWTFAIIAGAIWADSAWGRYWGWDPKETWSFITWVVYAGYLHARATAGWKGHKAAIIALIAFACLLFNFFGINYLVSGMHSYAGGG
jgi:cytochrome c-type biogenesis protein CcsB